jgi:hypothetical protein
MYQKNSIAIAVINQSVIRGLKRSLLAGLVGGVAYKCLDARDGSNLQLAWIVYWLASSSNWLWSAWIVYQWMYIVKSIAISSDHVSMDVNGGFYGGFDGGFDGGFKGLFGCAGLLTSANCSTAQTRG